MMCFPNILTMVQYTHYKELENTIIRRRKYIVLYLLI